MRRQVMIFQKIIKGLWAYKVVKIALISNNSNLPLVR